MKIRVTMKDPDTMSNSVSDAVSDELDAINIPADEKAALMELRCDKHRKALDKWFEYGEYLTVEFDMDAMTAAVIEKP